MPKREARPTTVKKMHPPHRNLGAARGLENQPGGRVCAQVLCEPKWAANASSRHGSHGQITVLTYGREIRGRGGRELWWHHGQPPRELVEHGAAVC